MVSTLSVRSGSSIRKSFGIPIVGTLGLLVLILMGIPFYLSAQEFPEVTPQELKEMIQSRADIVILDNQPKAGYDAGHIPGAISFPWVKEIKSAVAFPHDKPLILYCACDHEEDALHMAALLLEGFEYTNVKVLKGGWLKWIELGYPVEKKEKK
jgi:rhodanese-related sulfurtransferase